MLSVNMCKKPMVSVETLLMLAEAPAVAAVNPPLVDDTTPSEAVGWTLAMPTPMILSPAFWA